MAHVSLSSSVVLLATALCFFRVCGAVATTAAPSNMTTAASNMTTPASNMTTPASNMTTAASNMTTAAPSNMTTVASNMTTAAPSNMTTAASNMTTSNMTTSNMTTPPSNTTTAPCNGTTTPSNMTTTPSNMTTAPSETTTTPPMTTTVPEPKWKVEDKNNKTCMLMGFGGNIIIKNTSHPIPASASVAKSSCPPEYSKFVLEFYEDDAMTSLWELILNFTTTKGSFELHIVSVTNYVNGVLIQYGTTKQDFFDVPLGNYYYCENLNITAGPFNVNLMNPILQPFVQKAKGGSDLGYMSKCPIESHGNKTNIIIGVIIAVIVLIAAIVVTYFVVKRHGKPSDPPYSRVQ